MKTAINITTYTSKKTGAVYTLTTTETNEAGKIIYVLTSREDNTDVIHTTESVIKRWYKKEVVVDFTDIEEPETKAETPKAKKNRKIRAKTHEQDNENFDTPYDVMVIKSIKNNTTMEDGYSFEMTKAKARKPHNILAIIIANSFSCRALISDNKIGFFGHETNAKEAASSMEFILKTMIKGCNQAVRDSGLQPGQKGAVMPHNSYAIGFIDGIKASMRGSQKKKFTPVITKELNDAMNSRFDLVPYNSKGIIAEMNNDSYTKGFADGETTMQEEEPV